MNHRGDCIYMPKDLTVGMESCTWHHIFRGRRDRAEPKWWCAGRESPSSLLWPPPTAFHTPCPSHPLPTAQATQGFSLAPHGREGLCCSVAARADPSPAAFPTPARQWSSCASWPGCLKCQFEFHCVLAHFGLRSRTGIIQAENYSRMAKQKHIWDNSSLQ